MGRRRGLIAVAAVIALVVGGLLVRSASGADRGFPKVAEVRGHGQSRAVAGPSPSAPSVPSVPSKWVTSTYTTVSGGLTRSYLVAEPSPAPTTKVPVIVVLHGQAVTAAFEEARTGLVPVVGPAILVYPQGYDESWDAGTCCAGAAAAGVNDVAFITSVVDAVLADNPEADPSKVDLVGYSNGGRMAWTLACEEPQLFRAVATYGAVLDRSCSQVGPISALMMVGTADPELTINSATKPPTLSNGFVEPTVDAQTATLVANDRCGAATTSTVAGLADTTTWSDCADGRRVALTLYEGQDHTWPAGGGATPSGAEVIWEFFQSVGAA